MSSTGKQLDALLDLARNHVMTDAEREEQRQSWARGQSTPGPRQAVSAIEEMSPLNGTQYQRYIEACEAAARADERAKILAEFAKLEASLRAEDDVVRYNDEGLNAYQCVIEIGELIAKLRGTP